MGIPFEFQKGVLEKLAAAFSMDSRTGLFLKDRCFRTNLEQRRDLRRARGGSPASGRRQEMGVLLRAPI